PRRGVRLPATAARTPAPSQPRFSSPVRSSMAAKKRSSRSRRPDSTSPNTVLVLFLVFFVLLSIGLGVWGYYGYAGQKELKDAAVRADQAKTAAIKAERFANLFSREARVEVLGRDALFKEEGGFDEGTSYDADREEIIKEDGGAFSPEKTKKQLQDL